VPRIDRARIIAFRLSSHNLIRRLGPRSLVKAAAACGIQETPVGSAALALCARVDRLSPAALERALVRNRTLVHLWSLRGAPYVVPAQDVAVFTAGALPFDRASFNVFLSGWTPAIEAAGLDPFQLLDRMNKAARDLLDGRTRDVNQLRDSVLGRVRSLSRIKRPKEARHDMPEPLYRSIGLTGAACIVEGRGTNAVLARTDQWLDAKSDAPDVSTARAELVRRFLHCYGPSTAQRFAEWTARSLRDAKAAFELVVGELVEVEVGRGSAWLLAADRKTLESPPEPTGTRLIPVGDPFLQQRDRAMLLEDEAARKRLWRPVSGPGAVLVSGQVVGTWRARVSRSHLQVTVEPFDRLARGVTQQIEEEAARLAPFRGCDAAEVQIVGRA
jgi:Winged helix DNA-binding domain